MPGGLAAFGTTLERFDGEGFEPIARITSLSGPNLSRDTIDVTSHDSPNGWMEFIGSLKDAGEVSADVNRLPDVHDVLIEDFNDSDPRSYRMVFPTGAAWEFDAILTGYSADSPHDDKMDASLTWKITGEPDTDASID